jgi:hypothetical protein
MANISIIVPLVIFLHAILVAPDYCGGAFDAPHTAVRAVGGLSSCAIPGGPESSGKRVISVIIVMQRSILMQPDAKPCRAIPRSMTHDDDPVTQERVTMTRPRPGCVVTDFVRCPINDAMTLMTRLPENSVARSLTHDLKANGAENDESRNAETVRD